VTNSGPGHSTSPAHYDEILNAIFEVSENFKVAQWVIKLHRKDSIENFRNVLVNFPAHEVKIITSDHPAASISIYKWLKGASCIITGASTVAIEAMAVDIPVITMDLKEEYCNVDFIDQLATIHVKSSSELNAVVNNILNNKPLYEQVFQNSRNYAQKYFYRGTAKSSELISKELLKSAVDREN